jgi:hypothetical protein
LKFSVAIQQLNSLLGPEVARDGEPPATNCHCLT